MSDSPSPPPLPVEDALPDPDLLSQAVRSYLKTGSLAAVSRNLSVPIYELQKLARTQEWMQELKLLRTIEQAVLDSSLTSILDTTLDALKHRLEFGEDVMDKDGNIRTKPLNAQTLCRIAETVFDKRQLIRGLPTAVTNEGSKLAELAEKLEQLGRAQAARTIEMELPSEGRREPSSGTFEL